MRIYFDLFISMVRAGMVGFGGGPGCIPFIRAEAVDRYQWMGNDEFAETLALGNTLPGPIATKMAAFIGYKQAGIIGATLGVVGMVLPTAILIIALAKIYSLFKDSPRVWAMAKAVKPVIVILLLQVALEIGQKAFPDYVTYGIAGVTAVAVFYFKINPAYMILAALAFGAIIVK